MSEVDCDGMASSKTEALLPCLFVLDRGTSLYDLHQAGGRAHVEMQLAFKIRDHIERRPVVKMDRLKVRIGREDANSTGQTPEIPAGRTVLVVFRHIHRMKRDVVPSVPVEQF